MGAEKAIDVTDSDTRLVLRRSTAEKGNRIALRLASSVGRATDLYSLFKEGIVIEIIDVEPSKSRDEYVVTLGCIGPAEFAFDREEKLTAPRDEAERGAEAFVAVPTLASGRTEELSLEALDEHLARLRQVEGTLLAQQSRLKLDKSLASDRGYRHPNNDHYHRWVMLIDEMNVVAEQIAEVKRAIQNANAMRKARLIALNNTKRDEFLDRFLKVARAMLDDDDYQAIVERANAST